MQVYPLAFALVVVTGVGAASLSAVACSSSSSGGISSSSGAGPLPSGGGGPDSGGTDSAPDSGGADSAPGSLDGSDSDSADDAADGASCSQPSPGTLDGGDGGLCMLTQSGTYTLTETSMVDAASCPNMKMMFVFDADAGVCGSMARCTCVASEAKCTITTIDNGMTTTQTTDYTYNAKGYKGTVSSTTTDADGGVISMCTYSVNATKD